MPTPEFVRIDAAGTVLLKLRVHPGARSTGFSGVLGDALKLEIQTPPVDGKANAAVIRFLADELHLSRSAVTIRSGETSRDKLLAITGITVNDILSSLDRKK